ncbi:MAG: hypothetical protein KGL90_06080 [Burkholderiales bacterium]|nr:hypothetical protein [Burkholderiales bacterium]
MPEVVDALIPLNRSEHGYAAIDGLAGTMIQPYLLRFNVPIAVAEMRQALRELLSACPRLRGVLDPGLHLYRLRILPDDTVVDQLFDVAFRVEAHLDADDPAQMESYHGQMLNEPMPLERGLGARWRFVPHPTQPVLFFGVHHMLLDGKSIYQLLGDLIKRLNGHPIPQQPLEPLSMLGSIAPHHWWQWPVQVWRSRRHKVAEARRLAALHIQQVPTRVASNFSSNAIRHHVVPLGTADMRQAARKLGVSLNTFLISALSQSFLDLAPSDPQAAAVIRISVDLRKYYPAKEGRGPLLGNHVGAFLVIEQGSAKSVADRVRSVDAQIKAGQERYARREMCWTYLFDELLPLAGRTLIGHVARQLQRKDRFPRISCHATSVGDASALNPPDATIRLVQIIPAVPSISLLPVVAELDGRLYIPMSWQRAHTTVDEVDAYLSRLDATIARLVDEAKAAT